MNLWEIGINKWLYVLKLMWLQVYLGRGPKSLLLWLSLASYFPQVIWGKDKWETNFLRFIVLQLTAYWYSIEAPSNSVQKTLKSSKNFKEQQLYLGLVHKTCSTMAAFYKFLNEVYQVVFLRNFWGKTCWLETPGSTPDCVDYSPIKKTGLQTWLPKHQFETSLLWSGPAAVSSRELRVRK